MFDFTLKSKLYTLCICLFQNLYLRYTMNTVIETFKPKALCSYSCTIQSNQNILDAFPQNSAWHVLGNCGIFIWIYNNVWAITGCTTWAWRDESDTFKRI